MSLAHAPRVGALESGARGAITDVPGVKVGHGYLNDIQSLPLEPSRYDAALAAASVDFEQGSVGAGRGMSMFGVKGGVGSASRIAATPKRAGSGLARTGSHFGHGSGDVALAFTTAYRIPEDAASPMPALAMLHDARLDALFEAAAEATEHAIVNALFAATTVRGFRGHERRAFSAVLPGWKEA